MCGWLSCSQSLSARQIQTQAGQVAANVRRHSRVVSSGSLPTDTSSSYHAAMSSQSGDSEMVNRCLLGAPAPEDCIEGRPWPMGDRHRRPPPVAEACRVTASHGPGVSPSVIIVDEVFTYGPNAGHSTPSTTPRLLSSSHSMPDKSIRRFRLRASKWRPPSRHIEPTVESTSRSASSWEISEVSDWPWSA